MKHVICITCPKGCHLTVDEENGFAVTDNLDGMPNAFRAEYGEGRPVIAFLCEYDALSAMSQRAGCAVREPPALSSPMPTSTRVIVPKRPSRTAAHTASN